MTLPADVARLTVALCTAALAGCNVEPPAQPDQCLRVELFRSCMSALPAGPVSTHYNDWADVVKACESSAFYQSLRKMKAIKPECAA